MCLVSFLAPGARLALSSCLLAVLPSTFIPTCIVLVAASECAYRRRHPEVMLNFPGHPGIWSWDRFPEMLYPLTSEGERMAKITGHIRFQVREPQARIVDI